MGLSAVPTPPEEPDEELDAIPTFEGKPVHATKLVLKGVNHLECDDRVLQIDSIMRLTVEARVTDVRFEVDERSGRLERVHVAKAIDADFTPWDPDHDNGVIT